MPPFVPIIIAAGALLAFIFLRKKPEQPFYPEIEGPEGIPASAVLDPSTGTWYDPATGIYYDNAGTPLSPPSAPPTRRAPPPSGGPPGGVVLIKQPLPGVKGMMPFNVRTIQTTVAVQAKPAPEYTQAGGPGEQAGGPGDDLARGLTDAEKAAAEAKRIADELERRRAAFGFGGGGSGPTGEVWPEVWPNGGDWPPPEAMRDYIWLAYAYVRARRGVSKTDTRARMMNGVSGQTVLKDVHTNLARFGQRSPIAGNLSGAAASISRIIDLVYDGKEPTGNDLDSRIYYRLVKAAANLKARGETHNAARALLQGEGVPKALADFAVIIGFGR